ncbi:dephospho-CoA kinase [Terriglobus sp.]|uniref:dephospho-CoA kinase n=1 Tax=Terriglobus sp. TaxID=1889013 RepID=UPI003B00F5C7
MLRVALTGGIGSGKSTAAAIFRELGCFVSQSDEIARAMMQPGEAVYRSIVQEFGPAAVQADGSLDRAALARLAFAEGRVEELNSIVHPAVIAWQAEWMRHVGGQHPAAVAMVESALVFETKHGEMRHGTAANEEPPWRTRFDRIVLVTAPEQVRVQRYVDRYLAGAGASSTVGRVAAEADARARMRSQMPDEEKAALSDAVIANTGTLQDLHLRVTQIWQELRAEAADRVRE